MACRMILEIGDKNEVTVNIEGDKVDSIFLVGVLRKIEFDILKDSLNESKQ